MAKGPKKPKAKDTGRRRKKKVSVLTQESVGYVDWKDINLLRRFMSDRAKIRARQVTGNSQRQQTEIARAIKNAREMALLPYTNRITTQRSSSRARDDSRSDRPAPQPSAPPPGMRPVSDADEDAPEPMDMPVGDAGAEEAGGVALKQAAPAQEADSGAPVAEELAEEQTQQQVEELAEELAQEQTQQ